MSNPNMPAVPMGAAPINRHTADDEDALPVVDPDVVSDESTEDEDDLEKDLREGKSVNDSLTE